MTFDRKEHQEILMDMITKVSIPGHLIEIFFELKKAIITASVVEQKKEKQDA